MSSVAQLQAFPPGMSIQKMLDDFKKETGKLAFSCIQDTLNGRVDFADALFARIDTTNKILANIDQQDTSLCGPAAFIYCIAQFPDTKYSTEYVRYVLNLARTGRGVLGKLEVKPKHECIYQASLKKIAPVDWVALASLRDMSNKRASLCDSTSRLGGMTLPDKLAGWFSGTGWFETHHGKVGGTNIYVPSTSPLDSLLEIVPIGGHTCLLVNADFLENLPPGTFPTHWVVLCSPIKIGGRPAPHQYRGKEDLLEKPIEFDCWSWGTTRTTRISSVKEFLRSYYGYVSAISL